MKLSELLQGIQILSTYYDDPDGYHVGAEHDVLYLYATDRPLSAEHVARMLALGWFQESGATDDEPEAYDAEEGWQSFT
jgi:hypothetical protein